MSETLTKKEQKAIKKAKNAEAKAKLQARREYLKAKAAKYKRQPGDRIDGRRLRKIQGMLRFMPYLMPQRCDALNYFADSFDITEAEKFCREKVNAGMMNFSILHLLIAAYVRVVSQRPEINRFIAGQEIYAHHSIDVVMVAKKRMAVDSEETCIKVCFEPTDTVDEVYKKFNDTIQESVGDVEATDFDGFTDAFQKIPRWVFRFFTRILYFLDYHGKLPLSLLELSPFHGSMIITSMGSLGIKPIYHHIYNFGTLPLFISYGAKRAVYELNENGVPEKHKYIDVKIVTDERTCDGFHYASAFKMMKKIIANPKQLETPPETVVEDCQ